MQKDAEKRRQAAKSVSGRRRATIPAYWKSHGKPEIVGAVNFSALGVYSAAEVTSFQARSKSQCRPENMFDPQRGDLRSQAGDDVRGNGSVVHDTG